MNEVDKFFSDLPQGVEDNKTFDIAKAIEERTPEEETVTKSTEQETPVEDEKIPFGKDPKIQKYIDRQIRKRLEESKGNDKPEPQKVVEAPKDNSMPPEWVMAYGDSENSRQAWNFQQKLIEQAVSRAKEEAVQDIQNSFQKQKEAERQYESFITNSLESIEDSHDVDITSNAPSAKKLRSEFLELVKNLSPKDANGDVTEYADFNAAWDLFSATIQKEQTSEVTSQKKTLSSRSMVKSHEGKTVNPNLPKTPLGFGDSFFDNLFNG